MRHDALRVTSDAQKQMITGHVSVFENGKPIGEMTPAKWYFAKHEEEPTTEVAIRRGVSEDLYVVLSGYDIGKQTGIYAVTVNPLVNWIWFGFAVIALGTGLTVLPERAFAFAAAKVPEGAVTTTVLLLSLLSVAWRRSWRRRSTSTPRSALERRLEGEILCTCGCRRPLNNCGMLNCDGHANPDGEAPEVAERRQGSRRGDRRLHQGLRRSSPFLPRRWTRASTASPGSSRIWSARPAPPASRFVAFRWSRRDGAAGAPAQNDAGDDPDPAREARR